MSDEKRHYLSQDKKAQLEQEFKQIKEEKIPFIARRIDEAKQMGDLSENAAYSYAKLQLRRINNRIDSLKLRVANAIPIESGVGEDGRVRIGTSVTVRAGGREQTFEVVGAQETNPLRGRISYLSPIGAALMGKKKGEGATVATAFGEVTYEILGVR